MHRKSMKKLLRKERKNSNHLEGKYFILVKYVTNS